MVAADKIFACLAHPVASAAYHALLTEYRLILQRRIAAPNTVLTPSILNIVKTYRARCKMARQPKHNQFPPFAKYEVFRNAYGTVKKYLEKDEFLAANILAFAILEDRVLAAFAECSILIKPAETMSHNALNKLKFSSNVKNLHAMGVINDEIKDKLLNAADERNRQIHEMIWRLETFNKKTAETFKSLSYKVSSAHKKFLKQKQLIIP